MTDFDARARTWDADPDKAERALRVAEVIRREIPLTSKMNVLEYGCGTGLLGFALQPYVRTLALADTSREMLVVLREKIEATEARNMTPLLLDLLDDVAHEGRYDAICTLLTLHHIRDTDRILARFRDVLAPGGALCISDLDAEDGSFHGAGFDGHSGFDRGELRARLLRAGFQDVTFTTPYRVTRHGRQYPLFLAIARNPQGE